MTTVLEQQRVIGGGAAKFLDFLHIIQQDDGDNIIAIIKVCMWEAFERMTGKKRPNQKGGASSGTQVAQAQPIKSTNSISIIYEAIKTQLDRQIERARSIDSKASFIFVNSSVLFASALTLRATDVLPTALHQTLQHLYHNIIPIPAYVLKIVLLSLLVITYASVIWFSYRAYQISEFDIPPDIHNLYRPEYLLGEPDDTLLQMIYYMQRGYRENEKTISDKRDAEVSAYKLLLLQYIVVILWVVIQTVS